MFNQNLLIMKKQKFNPNEFTKFIQNRMNEVKLYKFDLIYDMHTIMSYFKTCRSVTNEPEKKIFHLMIREAGADMIDLNSNAYEILWHRNDKVWELVFCWNFEYFDDESFVEITKIK